MNNFITMTAPTFGTLLIAEPFLKDPSFKRTVVLICKHSMKEGTFGFTINKKLHTTLNEVVLEMEGFTIPLYLGGPVQTDTLHYIHQYPEHFTDAVKISETIYWGGNFEILKALLKNGTIDQNKVKFFLGYSGWDPGQLEEEIIENSWITSQASQQLIFDTKPTKIWNESLIKLGGKYKMMINFPIDPQLN